MGERIFISHSVKDKGVTEVICKALESAGWKCWIAPRDILPGDDWSEAIIDAINQSRLMVLVYSESSSQSIQIKREVERAASKGVTIIPFRVEDVPVSKSLEYYLSTAYWLDAISPPLEQHLQYLIEMIGHLAGTPKAGEAALRLGQCTECGTAMQPGVKQCDACGHVRNVPLPVEEMLPVTGRNRKVRRRPFFRLRSRAAKISIAIACLAILSSVLYLSLNRHESGTISVDAYLNQAMKYLNQREYSLAIEECAKGMEKDPSNPFLYRIRGDIYLRRGLERQSPQDFSQAVTDYTATIKLSPRDDYALFKRGKAYYNQGALDRALEDCNAAFMIADTNEHISQLHSARGDVYFKLSKYDLAHNDFSSAIKLSPNISYNYFGNGKSLFEMGDYEAAIENYTEAINRDRGSPEFYRERSRAYLKLNRELEANKDTQQVKALLSQ